jgi:formate--tetrahydrofolate ligase
MEDFNLHLTGDVHAIGAAHNLAARSSTTASTTRTRSGSIPHGILWPRVVDISDRALRHVVIGLGGREDGIPRETEYVITVGSEVMAVLALATDLFDLRARLGRIVLATTTDGKPITAEDLHVAGSMTSSCATRSSRTCSRRSRAVRPSSTPGRSPTSPTATTRSSPTGLPW